MAQACQQRVKRVNPRGVAEQCDGIVRGITSSTLSDHVMGFDGGVLSGIFRLSDNRVHGLQVPTGWSIA